MRLNAEAPAIAECISQSIHLASAVLDGLPLYIYRFNVAASGASVVLNVYPESRMLIPLSSRRPASVYGRILWLSRKDHGILLVRLKYLITLLFTNRVLKVCADDSLLSQIMRSKITKKVVQQISIHF